MLLSIRTFANRVLAGGVAASLVALAVTAGFTPLGSEPAQAAIVGQTSLATEAPTAVPAAPIVVDATGVGLGLGVGWLPDDPADAVTSFTVTATPVAGTETDACPSPLEISEDVNAPATGATVLDLCAQVAYTVTVTAKNAIGSSALSNVSELAVVLDAQPAFAPLITGALGRDGSGVIDWVEPSYDGGDALTGYHLSVTGPDGVEVVSASVAPSEVSTTVTGLTNGIEYQVSLIAVNSVGESSPSTGSFTPRSAYAPTSPRGLNVVPDAAGAIKVSWSSPADDGGAPVASYVITYQRAELVGGAWTPIAGAPVHVLNAGAANLTATATDFENPAASYVFDAAAVNSVGTGLPAVAASGVSPLVIIKNTTVILDEVAANEVDGVSGDTLVWSSPVPAQVSSVAVGDVLVSGVSSPFPSGLLREVTLVTTAPDGTVTLTTIEASLDDVFVSMSLSASSDMSSIPDSAGPQTLSLTRPKFVPFTSGIQGAKTAVSAHASASADFTIPVGIGPPSKGTASVEKFSMSAYGTIGVSADANIDLRLDGILHPSMQVTATVEANVSSSLDLEVSVAGKFLETPLGVYYGPVSTFVVGPVPVIVGVKSVLSVQAGGTLKFNVSATKTVGGSVTWNSKDPKTLVVDDLSTPLKVTAGPIGATPVTISAFFAVRFQAIVALYETGGPSISAILKFTVSGTLNPSPGEPWFKVTPSLELKAGVAMEVFGFRASAETRIGYWTFFEFKLYSIPSPTYFVTPPAAILNAGSSRTFTASRSDDVVKPVTWEIRGGVAGDTITPQGVFTPALPNGRIVSIVVKDASGAMGFATVTVGYPFDEPGSLALSAADEPFSLTATWSQPAHLGGASLTDYVVTTTPDTGTHVVSGTTESITLAGIEAGNYQVEVRARNANGRVSSAATASYITSGCLAHLSDGGSVFFDEKDQSCASARASGTMSTKVDGITYTVKIADLDAGAAATAYDDVSQGTDITIAPSVNIGGTDYAVTSVGDSAFPGYYYPNDYFTLKSSRLTSVNIPDSVTTIGSGAFGFNWLTSVTIPESVTTIGSQAFVQNQLRSVTIPDSVTTIGSGAFFQKSLESVMMMGDLPAIGAEAFGDGQWVNGYNFVAGAGARISFYARYPRYHLNNSGSLLLWNIPYRGEAIATVTFDANGHGAAPSPVDVAVGTTVADPGGLTATGYTFNGWYSAAVGGTRVGFPRSITSDTTLYAGWTTDEWGLTFLVDPANQEAGATIWTYDGITQGSDVIIPESINIAGTEYAVTAISDSAFNSDGLTSVTIPDSVVTIGRSAFYRNQLASVTIPDSVTSIGDYAFLGNDLTSLTIGNSVTTIGIYAFEDNKLTSLTLGDSVSTIGKYAFYSNQLRSVTIPASVTAIGDNAFDGNHPSLTDVIFLGDVPATLGYSPFSSTALVSYYASHASSGFTSPYWNGYRSQVLPLATLDGIAYSANGEEASAGVTATGYDGTTQGTDLSIPLTVTVGGVDYAVTAIGDNAFEDDDLTSVTIPDSVSTIGDSAFLGNRLTSITIPDSVATIGAYAFAQNQLTSVTVPSGDTSMGEGVFADNLLTSVTIPDSITTIGGSWFASNRLTSVAIPDSVTAIGDYAFGGNRLTWVTIPDSVTTIGSGAFSENLLTSVTIPASVTAVGDYAFELNPTLADVTFVGNAPATVGEQPFGAKGDPAGPLLSYYERNAGSGFSNGDWRLGTVDYRSRALATVAFDANGHGAAPSAVDVTIGGLAYQPPPAVAVGYRFDGWFNATSAGTAFDFATPVTADTIAYARWTPLPGAVGATIDGIAYAADSDDVAQGATATGYDGVAQGVDVTIPSSISMGGTEYLVTGVSAHAFEGDKLASVAIPTTVTTIGDEAFEHNLLTSVAIPDSVTAIANGAFANNRLTAVAIPDAVTVIGDDAFEHNLLTSVSIPDSVIEVGRRAFAGNRLNSATIGNAVTSIGDFAFADNQLTSLIFGDSVATVGKVAFANNRLTTVAFPDSLTSIGDVAFSGNGLTSVVIPDSVTVIGTAAFERNELESVTIPTSVSTVGVAAFKLNKLTAATIPDNVTSVGDEAFASNQLTSVIISESVTSIGEMAFYDNLLTSITIPDSVTTIAYFAFASNELASVVIPESVATTGEGAFFDNRLTSVTIPGSVTTIGDDTFSNNRLTSVTIPDSVTTIGDYAFAYNDLSSVTIPAAVTTVGDYAFSGGGNLAEVIFAGNAPTTFGTRPFGYAYATYGPVVSYYLSHAASGFTSGTWTAGDVTYRSQALGLVTFDANGHGTPPAPVSVVVGHPVADPGEILAPGYTFDGWFTAPSGGSPNNFTTPVTADLTMYAQWTADEVFSVAPVPTITGSTVLGDVLTANTGTWTPTPSSFTYEWLRDGAAISGATQAAYTLVEADLGTSITVSATAVRTGYPSVSKVSEATAVPYGYSVAPVPTITGSTVMGSVLTANTGTWVPFPNSFTYEWMRNGMAISGATLSTYTLVQADLGKTLTVSVTAVKTNYPATSRVSAGKAVPYGYSVAPVPTITGSTKVGSVLTANTGTWVPFPTSFTYVWRRNGVAISGATQKTYTVLQGDLGKTLTVSVTAVKTNYPMTSRVSAGKAVPYGYSVAPVPTITGSTKVGSVLTANAGTWTPLPTSFTYVWRRNGVAISGATHKTYTLVQGDLGKTLTVSVTAVKTNYPMTSRVSAGKAVPYGYSVAPVPTITGSTKVGSVLTASAGKWVPFPTSFTYVWRRGGVAISGATHKTYTLVQADRGKTLTVSVIAVKTNYPATSRVSAGKAVP